MRSPSVWTRKLKEKLNNLPKIDDTNSKGWLRSGVEFETQAVWHQRTVLLATALQSSHITFTASPVMLITCNTDLHHVKKESFQ